MTAQSPRALLGLAVPALVVATAVLVALNPWLAGFAALGILIGWLLRVASARVKKARRSEPVVLSTSGRVADGVPPNPRSTPEAAPPTAAEPEDQPGAGRPVKRKRRRIFAALALSGLVVAVGLFSLQTFGWKAQPPPGASAVLPVSYTARATLVSSPKGGESFELEERIEISQDALADFVPKGTTAQAVANRFLPYLTDEGWSRVRFVAGRGMAAERVGRSVAVPSARWPPRTTVTLPIPAELRAGTFEFDGGHLAVIAPKHTLLATAPSSDIERLPDGEQSRIALDAQESEVSVQVAKPLFRNDVGSLLLTLSLGGIAKAVLLLGWGVVTLKAKDQLSALFKRALGRTPVSTPSASPAPPPT